jgi:hypothetical protein
MVMAAVASATVQIGRGKFSDVPAGDEARFLHRTIGHGYTTEPALGATGEQECVTANEQQRQTQRAHVEAALRRRAAWNQARRQIGEVVADFTRSYGDRRLSSPLRQVERAAEVVAQRIERL